MLERHPDPEISGKTSELSLCQNAFLTKLDTFSLVCASLLPTGIVLGSAVFEILIGLVGLSWLMRSAIAYFFGDKGIVNSCCKLFRHPLVLPFFVWYIVIVISFLINNNNMSKLAYNLVFVRYVFFIVAFLDISRRRQIWQFFLYGLATSVLWAGFNDILAHIAGFDLLGHPLNHYTEKRHAAPRIAQLAAFAAPFFWGWSISLSDKKSEVLPRVLIERKKILVFLTLVAVVLVLVSDIRTFILAMVLGFLLIFIITGRKEVRKNFTVLGGLIALLAIISFQMGWVHRVDSILHRFYLWKVSWLMTIDHPLLGVSVSSYKEVFAKYASSDLALFFNLPDPTNVCWSEGYHAHNLFLMVLTVNGIVGLLAFVWLLVNAIRLSFQSKEQRWSVGLASWSGVFLFIGAVGGNIYDGATGAIFVFFLAMIGCSANCEFERRETILASVPQSKDRV